MKCYPFKKGFRFGNYNPPISATVWDILRYEIDELGNDSFSTDFDECGLNKYQLTLLSAADVVWVCKSQEIATQYNLLEGDCRLKMYEEVTLVGCRIICGDEEDGWLVIKPSGMKKLGLKISNEQHEMENSYASDDSSVFKM